MALQLCNSNQAKHAVPFHGLVRTLATPQLVNVGFNDDQLKRISEQDAQIAPCHSQLGPLDTVLERAQLPLQTTHILPQMTESSPLSFIQSGDLPIDSYLRFYRLIQFCELSSSGLVTTCAVVLERAFRGITSSTSSRWYDLMASG